MRINAAVIAASVAAFGGIVAAPAHAVVIDNPAVEHGRRPYGYDGYQDNGQPFYNYCGKGTLLSRLTTFSGKQHTTVWRLVSSSRPGRQSLGDHRCRVRQPRMSSLGPVVGP